MLGQTYQGWSNYATWRINLEIISDYISYGLEDCRDEWLDMEQSDLAQQLEAYVNELLDEEAPSESLVRSYADAFINEVNWREIAESVQEQCQEDKDYENSHADK